MLGSEHLWKRRLYIFLEEIIRLHCFDILRLLNLFCLNGIDSEQASFNRVVNSSMDLSMFRSDNSEFINTEDFK